MKLPRPCLRYALTSAHGDTYLHATTIYMCGTFVHAAALEGVRLMVGRDARVIINFPGRRRRGAEEALPGGLGETVIAWGVVGREQAVPAVARIAPPQRFACV